VSNPRNKDGEQQTYISRDRCSPLSLVGGGGRFSVQAQSLGVNTNRIEAVVGGWEGAFRHVPLRSLVCIAPHGPGMPWQARGNPRQSPALSLCAMRRHAPVAPFPGYAPGYAPDGIMALA
jgi:hypothetical protein